MIDLDVKLCCCGYGFWGNFVLDLHFALCCCILVTLGKQKDKKGFARQYFERLDLLLSVI